MLESVPQESFHHFNLACIHSRSTKNTAICKLALRTTTRNSVNEMEPSNTQIGIGPARFLTYFSDCICPFLVSIWNQNMFQYQFGIFFSIYSRK